MKRRMGGSVRHTTRRREGEREGSSGVPQGPKIRLLSLDGISRELTDRRN